MTNPEPTFLAVLKAAVAVCCLCVGIATHAQQANTLQTAVPTQQVQNAQQGNQPPHSRTGLQTHTTVQSQYVQARAQLEAAASGHHLVEEQFRLGLKNTAELLMSNSSLQEASQNLLQAKYTADLALRLLQYYQGIPTK